MNTRNTRSVSSRGLGLVAVAGLGAALSVGPGACGSPSTTVEAGALLLRVTVPPGGGNKPEHLQLWTYDGGGLIFSAVRVPQSGTLPAPASDGSLGTILLQPGTIRGNLRLHVRAFTGGARILDGVADVTAAVLRDGKLDLALSAATPADADGDDVPDAIDDCPARANPTQGGCEADAGVTIDGAGVDGGAGAGAGGATGNAGSTGNGGSAGRPGSGGASTGGAAGAGTGGVGTGGSGSGGVGTGGMGAGGARTGGMGTGGARTGGMGTGGARTGGMGTGGAPKVLGVTCASMNECASGFCVDGVCCESTCATPCRTCATGRCLEIRRADDVPECTGAVTCNNSARCAAD